MKSLLLSLVALSFVGSTVAAEKSNGTPASTNSSYPLTTCVVSGEPLGSMGEPVVYTYKQEGQPDRVVKFCCKACIKDFNKEPAKYLAKIDGAVAQKAAAAGCPAHAKKAAAKHGCGAGAAGAEAKACCAEGKACDAAGEKCNHAKQAGCCAKPADEKKTAEKSGCCSEKATKTSATPKKGACCSS